MAKDYYTILGVSREASEEDIKRAYRKLAHQHHPDKQGGNEAKFKEVNEAYQVLGNKEKRAQYDRFGQTFDGNGAPGGGAGGFRWEDFGFSGGQASGNPFGGFSADGGVNFGDFGDIFESIFDQFGGRPRQTYRRGSDIEAREELTLEEAFSGVSRTLRFKTHVACTMCAGLGYDRAKGVMKCTTCGGQGRVREEKRTFFGNFSQVKACPKCEGRGEVPNAPCKTCAGKGRVDGVREVPVTFAPGIEDGQVVKLQGQGEAGERGSETGDLYVGVHVRPHRVFTRTKTDLSTEIDVKVTDALLGREVRVRDIGGEEFSVSIPAGFNVRERLKVPGRGMPRFGSVLSSAHRGDLYISLNIKTPKHLSAKARKLLEEFEGEV
jgi:molecular chaperone DnaJ